MAALGAATKRKTGQRADPYLGYNFLVELQGLIVGGFTEVSGLDLSTEIEERRQGGDNARSYKLPKGSSYANLQLIRGLSDLDMLWGWYQDVVAGKIQRRNGTIYLLDAASQPAMWWNFRRAYPISWTGPRFDAGSTTVLTASVTLVHDGFEMAGAAASGPAGGKV